MTLAYETDNGIGTRARLGLIALQSDYTVEHDFHRLIPRDGVSLLVSRVRNATNVTAETLSAMEGALPAAASLFPEDAVFDTVAYGCTSGTSTIGAEAVAAQVRKGCTAKAVTDPVTGLIAACRALGVTRLGVVTPYIEEVNANLRRALAEAGIETPVLGSFGESEDSVVARIAPASIRAAALQVGGSEGIDAVFLSCTNLRTLDIIGEIEAETGLPALSSNQVMAWDLCRLAGVAVNDGFGRLTDG